MRKPSAIPLIHRSYVDPFVDFLEEIGAPVERHLAAAKLRHPSDEPHTSYYPARAWRLPRLWD